MVKELRNGWDFHEKQRSDWLQLGQPFEVSTAIKRVKSEINADDNHVFCSLHCGMTFGGGMEASEGRT